MKVLLIFSIFLFSNSCAVLYRVQMGEIDSTQGKLKRFEIMKSHLGITVSEGVIIADKGLKTTKSINTDQSDALKLIAFIYEISNMGPRTGRQTYSDTYLDSLAEEILKKCPSGNVTGLMSIREAAVYPVVSGEIGKIVGYCVED